MGGFERSRPAAVGLVRLERDVAARASAPRSASDRAHHPPAEVEPREPVGGADDARVHERPERLADVACLGARQRSRTASKAGSGGAHVCNVAMAGAERGLEAGAVGGVAEVGVSRVCVLVRELRGWWGQIK
jgi:hypothetical protein